jgi:myosin-crossreactive antigen
MLSEEKKYAKQVRKKPTPGQYALEKEELEWEPCRENFAKKFNRNQKGLYFSCGHEQEKNVIAFIEKTEEILLKAALQNIVFSNFYKTNLNFALWVEPAEFWMECSLKRSLFTLLLRCGLSYDFVNYEKTLFQNQYSSVTKQALQRFFYGFTKADSKNEESFEGIGKGWTSYFANKNSQIICEKLLLPDYLSDNKFPFGEEILWA